jgi:hypothetical protein
VSGGATSFAGAAGTPAFAAGRAARVGLPAVRRTLATVLAFFSGARRSAAGAAAGDDAAAAGEA